MLENHLTNHARIVIWFVQSSKRIATCSTGFVLLYGSRDISKDIWLDLLFRFFESMIFELACRSLVPTIPDVVGVIRDRLLILEELEAKTRNVSKQLDLLEQLKKAFIRETFQRLD